MTAPLDVIAMHGWASDARCWHPWRLATEPLGWRWQVGERGYGELAPRRPEWPEAGEEEAKRLVIGHSLGPHLLPAEVLRRADAVVLLASFANFVPPGRSGRRARAGVAGMAASLVEEEQARTMLANFASQVAAPQPVELLPPGPADGPLDEESRVRLRQDLGMLERCAGLPDGFPPAARVLIVEAGEDRIVEAETRAGLRRALPEAEVINLPGTGHALLVPDLVGRVVAWVESWRGGPEAQSSGR